MAHLKGRTLARLLSSRNDARTPLENLQQLYHLPHRSPRPAIRLYHQSSVTHDKASTPVPSPSPRPQQNKKRESLVWQRGKQKEKRNRISTLAIDPNAIAETEEPGAQHESHHERHGEEEDDAGRRKPADRILSRNQRRILLLSGILLLPVIGRDIMEVVIPGVLGTVIFVGGKIKSGIKWVRRRGSREI